MTSDNKKVIALVLPASGHINIMSCLVKELVNRKNYNVIFFSNEKYKDLVEKTGAQYKQYSNFPDLKLSNELSVFDIAILLMKAALNVLPELIKFCEEEKPDLILCDNGTYYGRFLINYLKTNDENGRLMFKMPRVVMLHSTFAMIENIYPNNDEVNLMIGKKNLGMILGYFKLYFIQKKINDRFKLSLPNEMRKVARALANENNLNLCAVFPELQPRADKLMDKFKFIGCCVSDDVRNFDINNEKFKKILNDFEPINPMITETKIYEKKLIYVSFGTIVNNKTDAFEKIIIALSEFELEPNETNSQIKSNNLEIIISVGNIVYEKFQDKIKSQNYKIPDNILILPNVPQIEILKRASLFITHAGMNSASETIHFGVPVICIPIMGDQNLVAFRLCDELNFGKKLDYDKFTSNQIRSCIHELLSSKKYLNNILEFTKISRKQNGIETGANFIDEYFKK
jgi:UDP:flavonoid glycosyltransferase YjiC (YdhE family)